MRCENELGIDNVVTRCNTVTMKRETMSIKVSGEERRLIEVAAAKSELAPATWMRMVLLKAAKQGGGK